MKLERTISYIGDPSEGNKGEDEFHEIDLGLLQSIFNPADSDPNLYLPYTINEAQAEGLKDIFDIKFDFKKYRYFLHSYESY